jgi:uncharacterized damage-inducible protein DinB
MSPAIPLPEPGPDRVDVKQQLVEYLDFYRHTIVDRVADLPDDEARSSRLPSGWSPLTLLNHLVHVERRWLHWGFAGRDLADVWGDQDADGRWQVGPGETAETLGARWFALGEQSRRIIEAAELTDLAPAGPRFDGGTATLLSILFHLLQESARHAGHMDIARELVDGRTGE